MSRLSEQLVATARHRLEVRPGLSEADLRRATSDLYYSLLHALSEALVESIGSNPDSAAFRETYVNLYRLPEHSYVEKRCKEIGEQDFSEAVQDFARQIISLKNKRQKADYDPLSTFKRSSVESDIRLVQSVLSAFQAADPLERVRFAYYASLRNKRPE